MSDPNPQHNLSFPHLMDVRPDRDIGDTCQPLMHQNFNLPGNMDLRGPEDELPVSCSDREVDPS